jgi:hypothetical protein
MKKNLPIALVLFLTIVGNLPAGDISNSVGRVYVIFSHPFTERDYESFMEKYQQYGIKDVTHDLIPEHLITPALKNRNFTYDRALITDNHINYLIQIEKNVRYVSIDRPHNINDKKHDINHELGVALIFFHADVTDEQIDNMVKKFEHFRLAKASFTRFVTEHISSVRGRFSFDYDLVDHHIFFELLNQEEIVRFVMPNVSIPVRSGKSNTSHSAKPMVSQQDRSTKSVDRKTK